MVGNRSVASRPLLAVSEEPDLRRDWQKRLLPNPAALFDFIYDERFRKTKLPNVNRKGCSYPASE